MARKALPRYCDDWACPLKWSCAHHFCRSRDYWAMAEGKKEFFRGHRTRWGCFDYRRDVAKPWLTRLLVSPGGDPPPKIPRGYKGPHLVE